ncbi:MAG: CoA transferase [Dehalococcoidia bacterium]|nr:CoA transferase [Dehalococcoidia bacterium]
MTDRALEGLRVVEFCDELGSYCGRLLADLGAEVIKVEPPGGGLQRRTPPFYKGAEPGPDTAIGFWVHNTSKKSVVLNLETDEGRAKAKQLALTADVVIEDNTPGWMADRGLGFEELRREKPSLVYTSITGFGQDGPHAKWAYSDIVGQATGGIMTLAGEMADPPNTVYGNQSDVSASVQAAQGTLIAVLHADATGEGQHVDVSAQESLSMSQETAMQTWDLQKRNRVRTGERGSLPLTLPALGVYPTKDGYVQLMILAPAGADFPVLVDWMREKGMVGDLDEEPYASLCATLNMAAVTQILGNPESAAGQVPLLMHIHQVVADFFATLTSVEAYEEGQRRTLLIGIVSTPKNLAENTQLRARNWFAQLDFDYLGQELEFPGPPYRLSETPAVIERPPRLGEHTDAILAELGG